MSPTKIHKLKIAKETVKVLSSSDLTQVKGGREMRVSARCAVLREVLP